MIPSKIKNFFAIPISNRGSALIIAYFVMFGMSMLAAGFAMSTFSELANARRYKNSVAAFWLAEAGISHAIGNPALLEEKKVTEIKYGDGIVQLTKDDSHLASRIVTATGKVGGIERSIQIKFAALAPGVFNNALSVNGNITITGRKATVFFNDKTRLSGKVLNKASRSTIHFEDKEEKAASNLVSLRYPDFNTNGKEDEFADFVQYNRSLAAGYPPDEVIYLKGNYTYTITPNSGLQNKKIIFVEGSEKDGDVIIQYGIPLQKGQNLTIISTGSITFNLSDIKDAQLNLIAWGDYHESAVLPGNHFGVIYTHGTAYFEDIHDNAITNGTVIANKGIVVQESWSNKTFRYRDVRNNGAVPAGFEGLIGGKSQGYATIPYAWKEI